MNSNDEIPFSEEGCIKCGLPLDFDRDFALIGICSYCWDNNSYEELTQIH